MNGHKFEYKCARMLRRKGFHHVEVTKKSGDRVLTSLPTNIFQNMQFNANIILIQLGIKQCKRSMPGANTMTATAASL